MDQQKQNITKEEEQPGMNPNSNNTFNDNVKDPITSSTSSSPTDDTNNDSSKLYLNAAEAAMRIVIAGFGGAIAGLSVSRRRGTFGATRSIVVPNRMNAVAAEKRKPYIDRDLPLAWAGACMGFVGIVEITRFVSPMSFILDNASKASVWESMFGNKRNDTDGYGIDKTNGRTQADVLLRDTTMTQQRPNNNVFHIDKSGLTDWNKALRIVGDYTLGGAIAGAAFMGSNVRTQAGARLAARGVGVSRTGTVTPVKARRSIVRGMIPGATLGFVAGWAMFGINQLEERLVQEEEKRRALKHTPSNEDEHDEEERILEEIRAEVEALTTEEIQRQIEELQRKRRGGEESGK